MKAPHPVEIPGPQSKSRPEMLPYKHYESHNLKKVASRHDVLVIFAALRKLTKFCTKISSAKKNSGGCDMKHKLPYEACTVGIVYELTL